MLAFIIRRIGQAALVLLAVGFVSFAMFKYMGDPLENLMGQEATLADRAELEERLGDDGVLLFPPFPRTAPRHRWPLARQLALRFDYAYTSFPDLGEVHRVSLSGRF